MPRRLGSSLEYADDRIDALMREYHNYISSASHVNMTALFDHIVNVPCKRFWVSEVRAAAVVAKMVRGISIKGMHPSKLEMYQEIYRRFCILRHQNPSAPLAHLVAQVIIQPAPKFYLSPSSAKIMVYKAKRKWFRKRKLRLSRSDALS